MDGAQPEASSSTSPRPVIHQATLVFDSGLSRERFQQLTETNGIVHSIVQRLMAKSGNNEDSLRVGLVITSQDAPYPNPRALHSILPAYRQDLRRPSAFLTSLPPLVHRFAPQAALARPKPGSILSDIWEVGDGTGLSVTSSEPGPSDHFLSGVVSALQLLEHHQSSCAAAPPAALRDVSPESALPMLSMLYSHPRSQSPESDSQYLIVFTEKSSLATIDSDPRGSSLWAREYASAPYDDVDWDTIGDRCKTMNVACSCIIVASPESTSNPPAPLGRQESTAEKLQKMCQSSHAEGPDDVWFSTPNNSDVYLTAMALKPTAIPAAAPMAAPEPAKQSPMPAAAPAGPTEAQIKYQAAQKQAMSLKMAQTAKAQGNQAGGFNVLASLISSGRLDPNIMAQLIANVRSDDPALREKAMRQLTSLMQLQASQKAQMGPGGQSAVPNATSANNLASANGTAAGNSANQSTVLQQQQQFLASMQARQAQQAQLAQSNQQNAQTLSNQQNQTAAQSQQSASQAAALQQQQLLLQRQQALAAQHNASNTNPSNAGAAAVPPAGTSAQPGQGAALPIWSGSISWMMKGQERTVIPVQCGLLSSQMNSADLLLSQWPSNLEMSAMTQMNMNDLQMYVKEHRAPCVLFSVSPQADAMARSKMAFLTTSLGQKSLCAYIKFGDPGCGILLISTSGPSAAPNGDKAYRLLGVVCLKTPFTPSMTGMQGQSNPMQGQQQQQQQQQQQPLSAANQPNLVRPSINGPAAAFPSNLQSNISPQYLQQAQLQSQLLQQQQQQNQAAPKTPQSGHARTPSQNLGPSPMSGTPLQQQQQRLSSASTPQQPSAPTTLQQFAIQPNMNMQTIQQQLQMRQLQAQAQSLQPNIQQQQQQQQQQQPQQQQPGQQQVRPSTFTPQQRTAIIRMLQDAGIAVSNDFDPHSIPREQLASFVTAAKERQKLQMQQQHQQQQQAAAAALGGKPQMQSGNLGSMNTYSNLMNNQQFNFQQQQPNQQGGQQNQTNLGNLQGLGQFTGMQQFQQQGQNGQPASALGLFAAQQGINSQMLGQFQHNQ